MTIYIYSKASQNINVFEDVLDSVKKNEKEILVTIEHKRNFKQLEKIKTQMNCEDILIVGSLNSLGISKLDIANELSYFSKKEKILIVANIDSTYRYGISQPMNKAVIETILDSIVLENNIVKLDQNKKSNAGRNKIDFPDNREELYEKWEKSEISSKKFMEESGLKKATFYNMITEYKEILKANEGFIEKFNLA